MHGLGRYVLSTRLSSGALGDLFVARDRAKDGPPCLLKRVHDTVASGPHVTRLLHTEAPAGIAFAHASAVRFIEFGRATDTQFLVFEMVRGQPLSDVLRRTRVDGEPLGQRMIAWIGAEVARVLGAAHGQSWFEGAASPMVHGAVSPRGIIVGYDGKIQLTGLGYGRARSRVEPAMGRMAFAAPEVLNGRDIAVRTDVYGLGITLHYAFAGRSVYRRRDLEATRAAVLAGNAPPLPPRSLHTPQVGELLQQMMAPRVDARPASMAAVQALLTGAAGDAADFQSQLGARVASLFADEREAQDRRLDVAVRPNSKPRFISGPPQELQLSIEAPVLESSDAPNSSPPAARPVSDVPTELEINIDEPELDRTEQERLRVAAVLRLAAEEAEAKAKHRADAIAEAQAKKLEAEHFEAEVSRVEAERVAAEAVRAVEEAATQAARDEATQAAEQEVEPPVDKAPVMVPEPMPTEESQGQSPPRDAEAETARHGLESGVAIASVEFAPPSGFAQAIFGNRGGSGVRPGRKNSPPPSAIILHAPAPVVPQEPESISEPESTQPFAGLLDQAADAGIVDHLPEFGPNVGGEDSLEVDIVIVDEPEVEVEVDLESFDALEPLQIDAPEPVVPTEAVESVDDGAPSEYAGSPGRFSHYRATQEFSDSQESLRVPACDIALQRDVWLDLAEPASQSGRFETLSTLLARVNHPHLPAVLDVGYEQGRAFRVRRSVSGAQLAEPGAEQWSEDAVREVLIDLAQGLEALHAAGLCAGGIRMQDVWQNSMGNAVLAELPRLFEVAAGEHPDVAQCLDILPPEYSEGAAYSPAGDLFCLGLLGHRLLTGEDALPMEPEVRTRALRGGQISAPAVDDVVLQEGLRQLLAPAPRARFARAAEVVRFLSERSPAPSTRPTPAVAEGTAQVILVDPDVTPGHVQRVLLQRGVRAAVFAELDPALAELESGQTRALVVARTPRIDEFEVRRRAKAVNSKVDLRFVPPAASRMVGPPVSLEGLADAWLALAPRVVALGVPEPGFVPTAASRVMAQNLGLGLRAELLAGLTAAAHLLCRRLGESPQRLSAALPEEVPALLNEVAGVVAGTQDYDDAVPVVRVVTVADSFYRSTRLDGVAPSRALADLKSRFGGPKGLVVIEALLAHLRDLYATGDLAPPAGDAPRVLLARSTRAPALVKMLEFDGFQIEEAQEGDAAWELLRTTKPAVVLLDAKLRGRDAAAIIELSQVHPALQGIRFLLSGGVDDAAMLQRVAGLDHVQIVDRSVSVEALRAHVSALIFADDD